jgi:hypothetical protein
VLCKGQLLCVVQRAAVASGYCRAQGVCKEQGFVSVYVRQGCISVWAQVVGLHQCCHRAVQRSVLTYIRVSSEAGKVELIGARSCLPSRLCCPPLFLACLATSSCAYNARRPVLAVTSLQTTPRRWRITMNQLTGELWRNPFHRQHGGIPNGAPRVPDPMPCAFVVRPSCGLCRYCITHHLLSSAGQCGPRTQPRRAGRRRHGRSRT